jgi:phosphoribosylformylglycinamidine synthase
MSVESKVIYVEKRKPYDIEAKQLCRDFITNLQIANLQYVRLIKKYLVSKIDTKTYTAALKTIFHEPQVDSLSSKISIQKGETAFAVALLPGQFDQRADSAEQCLKLINPQAEAFVKSTDVIILGGVLTPEEIEKIKKYYINPTDSIEVDVKNDSAHQTAFKPLPIKTITSFIKWNDKQITKFHLEQKLAMSIADLILIQQYFRKLKRDPTITEIKVIDTY